MSYSNMSLGCLILIDTTFVIIHSICSTVKQMQLYRVYSGGRGIFQYQIHLYYDNVSPSTQFHNILYDCDFIQARLVEKVSRCKTVPMYLPTCLIYYEMSFDHDHVILHKNESCDVEVSRTYFFQVSIYSSL